MKNTENNIEGEDMQQDQRSGGDLVKSHNDDEDYDAFGMELPEPPLAVKKETRKGNPDIAKYGEAYRKLSKEERLKQYHKSGLPRGPRVSANWLSQLGWMTRDELMRVEQNPHASVLKRSCAKMILDTLDSTNPEARVKALKEIMDRTEGQAIKRAININQEQAAARTPSEVLDELRRLANYGQPG
jgi:hypothetical protein